MPHFQCAHLWYGFTFNACSIFLHFNAWVKLHAIPYGYEWGEAMDEGVLKDGKSTLFSEMQVYKRKQSRHSVTMKEYFITQNFHVLKDLERNANL